MTEPSTDAPLDHDAHLTVRASTGPRAVLLQTETWLLGSKKATYGVAVLRIGFGLILAVMLLTSYSTRHFAWGAGRDWAQPRVDSDIWWSVFDLLFGAGAAPWLFDVQYLVLIVLSLLLVLGWRSRIIIPLTLIGFIGLTRANPFISDGGLQLFRIALVYLCLVDTSLRWSVDARRRERLAVAGIAPTRRQLVPAWLDNLLHNTGVILLVFQMCIIYVASSMFKIQGDLWQGGTAIYYVLQLDEFATWPQITGLIDTNGLIIGSLTYLTVFVQLFFPFLLLQRTTRILGLIIITLMHVGIGVFMGLMYFSFTMIAIDSIFIRDVTYQTAARRAGPVLLRLRSTLVPVSGTSANPADPAGPAGPAGSPDVADQTHTTGAVTPTVTPTVAKSGPAATQRTSGNDGHVGQDEAAQASPAAPPPAPARDGTGRSTVNE